MYPQNVGGGGGGGGGVGRGVQIEVIMNVGGDTYSTAMGFGELQSYTPIRFWSLLSSAIKVQKV